MNHNSNNRIRRTIPDASRMGTRKHIRNSHTPDQTNNNLVRMDSDRTEPERRRTDNGTCSRKTEMSTRIPGLQNPPQSGRSLHYWKSAPDDRNRTGNMTGDSGHSNDDKAPNTTWTKKWDRNANHLSASRGRDSPFREDACIWRKRFLELVSVHSGEIGNQRTIAPPRSTKRTRHS